MYDTIKEAGEAILGRLSAGWTTTPIAWPNRTYSPNASTAFIRPKIQFSARTQASLGTSGNRVFRTSGVLIVQVFALTGNGPGAALSLVDALVSLFEGVQLSGGLVFRAAEIREIGQDGPFSQTNITFPFFFDMQK